MFMQTGGDFGQSKAGEQEACVYDFSNRSVAFQSRSSLQLKFLISRGYRFFMSPFQGSSGVLLLSSVIANRQRDLLDVWLQCCENFDVSITPSLENLFRSAKEEAGVCPHGGRLQEF